MTKIKFGTDGWRAIIAQEYTVDNVKRVADATAKWVKENNGDKVVIGHDCRFAGQLFAETAARVLGGHGIKVHLAKGFVSTPMVSLGVLKTKAEAGVVITASHNPPSYNGFKLKSSYGGPTIPADISKVEALIPEEYTGNLPTLDELHESGLLNYIDLEDIYYAHVADNFDLDAMRNSEMKIAYDAMYGAGMGVLPRILPNAVLLHCDDNPSFKGQAPEPILRNLSELAELVKSDPSIGFGLANDGDADRIGAFDGDGNFVDSHHLLLLILHYLHKYKELTGKVVITFSVSDKVKKLAEHYGLECEVTKIGFKYIAEIMTQEDVLVGGEESGGLAAKGHIPERDGIWMGLIILEFMAKTGKSLQELIQEIYDIVGPFAFDRDDLHISEDMKQSIIEKCKTGAFDAFGDYPIIRTETVDGYKFIFDEDSWVMVRPSGTEPVLRVYAQGRDHAAVRQLLDAAHATLQS
ncbi:MAG: phosphoglucomutase/phosphomannomutase family protein [Bacteroidota bacterium]